MLRWTIARLERGITQITHPRYFGLFNPAPTFPSQCADRVIAALNPQLATATTSPAAVAIEAHLIRAVAAPRGAAARRRRAFHHRRRGGERDRGDRGADRTRIRTSPATGARCFDGAPTLYISREAHLAWIKIAHQTGIGRDAVRLVPTDGSGRMDPDRLAAMIAADRRDGRVPVMIAATAGTTGAGMIDPLPECAGVARRERLWLHVDAAWGGALIASPRHRAVLDGIERADSITIDAHKWFATTMGCGMFLVRDPGILSAAFQVATSYMPSNQASLDPYVTSIQWSRRFAGLRLFLSLAAAGWDGYADHVERAIALAGLLANRLRARGWRIVNNSPLAVLCIAPPPGSADAGRHRRARARLRRGVDLQGELRERRR